jgi:DNA (cytosine-5)-methyltransferase 1
MRFGSVCSGIEAASVAFGPLGWEAAWFSEIEPFPCAVLAHHYPQVPNLGDMTTIRARIEVGEVEAPDLLCGGTPCQAFSVAGLRRSLDDARGNLSLEFIRIADAIDRVRCAAGQPPAWVLWENVPGVLSTRDNAFGAFLGGLCGGDAAIPAPADGWPSAGVVAGPSRVVAWRVLDAQFFGVAQRRKRVFVLALGGPGAWACADALLPVSDRMRWHPAPRREAGQGTAAGVAPCLDASFARLQGCSGQDANHGHGHLVTHALRGEGFDASEDGTVRGTPLVPVLPFDTTQMTSAANRSQPRPGDPCHPLAAGAHAPAIAFAATDYESGAFDQVEQAAPLTTSADRTRAAPVVAWSVMPQNSGRGFKARPVEVAQPLMAGGPVGGNQCGDYIQSTMQVRRLTVRECERLQGFENDYTLVPYGRPSKAKLDADFLKYQLRGNPKHLKREDLDRLAADGPRYKALGNSWAVPNVRWIGRRINAVRAWAPTEPQTIGG